MLSHFAPPVRRPRGALVLFLALALGSTAHAETKTPLSAIFTNTVAQRPPAPRRPNIILIVADDLGYGDLGCYGQTRIQTPNLDKMAGEGIRFTDFYAGSAVGAPSRCVLMTGLDSGHACIRGNGSQSLREADLTVAQILHQAGYHTGCIGKWDLGNENSTGTPREKGFDDFAGYLDRVHAQDYYTDHLWRSDSRTGTNRWEYFPENQAGRKGIYMDDLFTKAALNFIKINKPDQFNHHRPFFLYLAYTIPHANSEATRRSGNGMQVPDDVPYSDQPWPQPEKNKAAMITRLDDYIGKLLEKLQELKIDDNTVVLFTSDNGPHKEGGVDPKFFQSAGPLRGLKGDLYEGGIRVPMIVHWPARIKTGRISNQVWAFWDFLPTAAEIALTRPPANIDGISMLPTLLGRRQSAQHDYLYWESHEHGFQQAVRLGRWKALRPQPGAPLELYDLQTDIAEKNNVAQQHPDVVQKIEACLKGARTDSPEWPVRKPGEAPQKTHPSEQPTGRTS